MTLPAPQFQARVDDIVREWNRAELYVKTAEQVCGEPVMPAIQELRYAGRRLIEMHERLSSNALDGLELILGDAYIDCLRAQHDAVDTAVALVLAELAAVAHAVGYDVVLRVYPAFAELNARFIRVNAKTRVSRLRRDDRVALYESIHADDFVELAVVVETFRASIAIMEALAAKERADRETLQQERDAARNEAREAKRWAKVGIGVSAAVGLLAVCVAIIVG